MELNFWKRYFSHISFGEEFSDNECKQLIVKYQDAGNIIPYFYLYLFDKKSMKQKKTNY